MWVKVHWAMVSVMCMTNSGNVICACSLESPIWLCTEDLPSLHITPSYCTSTTGPLAIAIKLLAQGVGRFIGKSQPY